jgi:hypothetical protein
MTMKTASETGMPVAQCGWLVSACGKPGGVNRQPYTDQVREVAAGT